MGQNPTNIVALIKCFIKIHMCDYTFSRSNKVSDPLLGCVVL